MSEPYGKHVQQKGGGGGEVTHSVSPLPGEDSPGEINKQFAEWESSSKSI